VGLKLEKRKEERIFFFVSWWCWSQTSTPYPSSWMVLRLMIA